MVAGSHSRTFKFPVIAADLGEIKSGASWIENNRKFASLKLPPAQEGTVIDNNGKDAPSGNDHKLTTNSLSISPSTHGALVTSDFFIEVKCVMDGCVCCQAPPSTSMPIQVYSPALKVPEIQAPIGWQPTVMSTNNIVLVIDQQSGYNPNLQNQLMGNPMMGNPMMGSPMMLSPNPQFQQQGGLIEQTMNGSISK